MLSWTNHYVFMHGRLTHISDSGNVFLKKILSAPSEAQNPFTKKHCAHSLNAVSDPGPK